MTRLFYDTEFLDTGCTIDLISIGIVSEDGREYYAVNSEAAWCDIREHAWLVEHVLPSLPRFGEHGPWVPDPGHVSVRPRRVIANEVREFIQATEDPELWAWYAAYDHVALAQLWGPMVNLPKGVPMYTCDLKQEVSRRGNPRLPKQESGEHNALADARQVRAWWEYLEGLDS